MPAEDSLCTTDSVIAYSRLKDTEETILQVRYHNAAWSAVCPQKPIPPKGN